MLLVEDLYLISCMDLRLRLKALPPDCTLTSSSPVTKAASMHRMSLYLKVSQVSLKVSNKSPIYKSIPVGVPVAPVVLPLPQHRVPDVGPRQQRVNGEDPVRRQGRHQLSHLYYLEFLKTVINILIKKPVIITVTNQE